MCMRTWLLPTVVLLVLSGCADVSTSDSSGSTVGSSDLPAAGSAGGCVVPSDAYPGAITLKLKPPAAHLQRPLGVKNAAGLVFLAAEVTTMAGSPQAKGAVWVAKDLNGTGVAALTDEAKAASDLPDAATLYRVSASDPAVAKARACSAGA
jgi:hypothetical protein